MFYFFGFNFVWKLLFYFAFYDCLSVCLCACFLWWLDLLATVISTSQVICSIEKWDDIETTRSKRTIKYRRGFFGIVKYSCVWMFANRCLVLKNAKGMVFQFRCNTREDCIESTDISSENEHAYTPQNQFKCDERQKKSAHLLWKIACSRVQYRFRLYSMSVCLCLSTIESPIRIIQHRSWFGYILMHNT